MLPLLLPKINDHFFFSLIFLLCFASNSFGAGYTCPASKKYTSCNTGFYLNGTSPGNSCTACTTVSFTDSGTDTGTDASGCTDTSQTVTSGYCKQNQTRTGSRTWSQPKSRTCYRTGGAGGTNGASACTGSANCGSYSYGTLTYGTCSYTAWTNSGGLHSCACPSGMYLSGTSCNNCTGVSFTETGTDTETITGGTRSRSKSRTCYRTGGAGGTNGASACTGSGSCGDWSYGAWTYSCGSGYTATSSGCSCNTDCTAVSNTTSTTTGTESCSITNGAGSRSYTNKCSGKYTSGGCSSAGATCTGCSAYGTRVTTGTCYVTSCNTGYSKNASSNATACNCTTPCTSVSNTSSTQSCTRTCSVTGGSCTYSGSTQTCAGKYTSSGCSSAGASCSGCSAWGACSGGTRYITCPSGTYWDGSACASCEAGYYCPGFSDKAESSLSSGYGRSSCTNKPANSSYSGSATTDACPWSCNAGYYGSSANGNTSCADCGSGNYCTGGTHRASCSTTVKAGSPTPSSITSLSSGSWTDYTHGASANDCICNWYFSDDTRTQYLNQRACVSGPGGTNYTKYYWCRTGYYATEPQNFNEWYNSCSACTNKPANSTYTGYSVPSEMYAVESNCPWQCNANYYKNGSACSACNSGYSAPAGSTTASACTKSCTRACTQQTCPANATCSHGNTSTSGTDKQGVGCDAPASTCSITVTCNPGYYKNSNGTCTACEDGYFCTGNNSRTVCTTLGAGYTKSDGTRKANIDCYQSCSKACTQQTCPSTAYSCSHGSTSTSGTQHYNGTCTATASTCSLTVNSCKTNNYKDGNACKGCPSGYPNSDNGNTGGITACYSNNKSRAWTGSQVNGTVPTNCSKVTEWNACSIAACTYVAYSNSAGTGDGTIKSGCSTNSANCAKTVKAVAAKAGYYDDGTTCPACSSLAGGFYPNSSADNEGGASACYTNSLSGKYVASANATSATNCDAGYAKAAHTVKYGGTSSCDKCGAGTYAQSGAASCSPCSGDAEYQPNAGASSCIGIPHGYVKASNSSVTPITVTCPAGQFMWHWSSSNGKTTCESCHAGYYCPGGTNIYGSGSVGRPNSAGVVTIYSCPSQYLDGGTGLSAQNQCKKTCGNSSVANGYIPPNAGAVAYPSDCGYNAANTVCNSGYNLTSGNACAQLCTAGATTLKLGSGVTVPLYSAKQTTRVIGIGIGNQVCYGSLATGAATGALNVTYDGATYHSIN